MYPSRGMMWAQNNSVTVCSCGLLAPGARCGLSGGRPRGGGEGTLDRALGERAGAGDRERVRVARSCGSCGLGWLRGDGELSAGSIARSEKGPGEARVAGF